MIISDLNYLEVTSEEIFGGRGVETNSNANISSKVDTSVTENISKVFNISVGGIQGSTAEAVVSSDASGNNTLTSIVITTQTEPGRSESFGSSVAVSA